MSDAVLRKHLIHGWDLALVEVAVFKPESDTGRTEHLLVPHLSGAVAVDERQVVHVVVDDKRTQVETQEVAGPVTVNRQKWEWDEDRFFAETELAPAPLPNFARQLRLLGDKYAAVSFDFGSGKGGSLIVKRNGNNVLELHLDSDRGFVSFRPDKIAAALDQTAASTTSMNSRSYSLARWSWITRVSIFDRMMLRRYCPSWMKCYRSRTANC